MLVYLIQNDSDNDGTANDDPFVVLIKMQRADGLSDQHNQCGPQHGVDGVAPATA